VSTVVKDVDSNGCHIKLLDFEGPFELLYNLVSKEELNIWDIPLARITREYLEYLQTMQDLQVHLAADFMVMAASLLHLKSRLLLPSLPAESPEGLREELYFGSKEELVRCLLEYRFFKSISIELKKREEGQKRIYLRALNPQRTVCPVGQLSLSPFSLEHLKIALQKLKERKSKKAQAGTVPFSRETEITLSAKIRQLLQLFKSRYAALECYLEDFLLQGKKNENVVTFVAFLELARRGKVSLLQKKLFGKVRIIRIPDRK
jgi:segregation and condensation protein A